MFFFFVFFFLSFCLLAFQSLIRLLLISVKTGPFNVSSTKVLHSSEQDPVQLYNPHLPWFTAFILGGCKNSLMTSHFPVGLCVLWEEHWSRGWKSWILSVDMQCVMIPLGIHSPSLRLSFSHLYDRNDHDCPATMESLNNQVRSRAFSYSASTYYGPSNMRHLEYRNKGKVLLAL